jgi:hypothetical protein
MKNLFNFDNLMFFQVSSSILKWKQILDIIIYIFPADISCTTM